METVKDTNRHQEYVQNIIKRRLKVTKDKQTSQSGKAQVGTQDKQHSEAATMV